MNMTTEIQKSTITESDLKTLYSAGIIPAGTPRGQIDVFAQVCREKGLSPFSKEIYLVGYNGRYSVIVGINGFRKKAAETGQYAGQEDVKFNVKSDGSFCTAADLQGKIPFSATVTVYRAIAGVRCPFTHTAVFTEFSTGKQKWKTMPFQMIAKVAEAFALRKGFSDELSGLSIPEEMGAIKDDTGVKISTPKQKEDRKDYLMDIEQALDQINSLDELKKYYGENSGFQSDAEITQLFTDRKIQIEQNG